MISKKIFFTKLFRSKNKFLDLEKKLIVSLPENQHLRYFDILPVYIMEIPVVGNNLTIFKKIRLYATTITKLFYEISFFQW